MAANRQKTLTTQDMKKHLLLILLTIAGMLPAMAQVQFGTNQYAVRLNIGYNHNTTYGSYAGVDFGAFMPINQHFEMQADLRFTTANNHAIGVQMRPKFAVPVGEFFLEGRLLSGLYPKDGFNELVQAIAVGYRMEYVSFQVGMSTRLIMNYPYNWHENSNMIVEPFNICYKLEVFVRPQASPWNISLCASNMTDYQIERVWQPMFMANGRYNINEHWQVNLSALCKPTGMFHLNAKYYGAEVRAGFAYQF